MFLEIYSYWFQKFKECESVYENSIQLMWRLVVQIANVELLLIKQFDFPLKPIGLFPVVAVKVNTAIGFSEKRYYLTDLFVNCNLW